MATKLKFEQRKGTVADAVSAAWGELESLRDEVREIVDNASDGLRETNRIQTLESTADTLDNHSEPEVPDDISGCEVTWSEQLPRRKGRGLSRADRCSNACLALDAVIEWCNEAEEDPDHAEHKDDISTLRDELENIKGDAEGCEFPGMYG